MPLGVPIAHLLPLSSCLTVRSLLRVALLSSLDLPCLSLRSPLGCSLAAGVHLVPHLLTTGFLLLASLLLLTLLAAIRSLRSSAKLWTAILDLRSPILDLRSSILNLRSSVLNPRSSLLSLWTCDGPLRLRLSHLDLWLWTGRAASVRWLTLCLRWWPAPITSAFFAASSTTTSLAK